MRIHAETRDFGRFIDVYIFEDGPGPVRQLIFKGPEQNLAGSHAYEMVEVPEGVKPSWPSFSLSSFWVGPLVDALTDFTPTKIDQRILDTLAKEQDRVDKMIDAVSTIALATPVYRGV